MIPDDAFELVGDERAVLTGLGVDVPVQLVHGLAEGLGGLLVHVRDGDPRGKLAVVGVLRRQERRRLRGKVVQLRRADAVKDTRDHLLRDNDRVDVLGVEAVAQLLDARGDLVEGHRLFLPIALDHQHLEASVLVVWTCGCGATHGVRPQRSIACVQSSTTLHRPQRKPNTGAGGAVPARCALPRRRAADLRSAKARAGDEISRNA